MNDPFLNAHRVGNMEFYNLAGRISPVSIRDQMVRAQLLVQRLIEQSTGGPETIGPLFIAGAGACGVTAAIAAAEAGIQTFLVDGAPQPFARQFACHTRWVDPTQYDWPLDHWEVGVFPWEIHALASPLSWDSADYAHYLAAMWVAELAYAQEHLSDHLDFSPNTKLLGIIPNSYGGMDVYLSNNGENNMFSVKVIILTVGFGTENCSPPNSSTFPRSYSFWESDPFGLPSWGLQSDQLPARIIISGAGDGALQDFLRIVTRQESVSTIYKVIRNAIPYNQLQVLRKIEHAVQSAEERHRNALHWGTGAQHDHTYHFELERIYSLQIDELLNQTGVATCLDNMIDSRPEKVWLVYSCSHFISMYGFNRFLAMLIAKRIEMREHDFNDDAKTIQLVPSSTVHQVECRGGHVNLGRAPEICHGLPHEITLKEHPVCSIRNSGNDRPDRLNANVVILRHGINPVPYLLPHAHPRQILPYYLGS